MIALLMALGLFAKFEAFLTHLETICTVVGFLAIIIPAVDQAIRKMGARHPNSRFWKWADKAFFGCGNALVNIGDVLDKMLAKKKSISG